jgi:hypothetical protein
VLWTRQRQARATMSIVRNRFMMSSCVCEFFGRSICGFREPEVVSKEKEAYEILHRRQERQQHHRK